MGFDFNLKPFMRIDYYEQNGAVCVRGRERERESLSLNHLLLFSPLPPSHVFTVC